MDGPPRPSSGLLKLLVDMYDPAIQGADSKGHTLNTILAWPDAQLENCHDYIQLLFPLPESSVYSLSAPVVDEQAYLYFRQHEDLRHNVRRAFRRLLAFYGFRVRWEAGSVEVVEARNAPERFANWVRSASHNHLRITRILRSLRTLGLDREAAAFFAALETVVRTHGKIGKRSHGYWTRAATRPLYEAPDHELVSWLCKYED